MQDILLLDKQVGETPLQRIERFKKDHPDYEKIKMTYAGRLDPIAQGLLLVLAGERVHEKERFLKLDKTYECTAIVGMITDTYDILGMPSFSSIQNLKILKPGVFTQKYPPYSSKTINGKQMHQLAREGNVPEEVPAQEVIIKDVSNINLKKISKEKLLEVILNKINLVIGDFRQIEIKQAWKDIIRNADSDLSLIEFKITVSSGTYIRSIVNDLGGCILELKRTQVGEYKLP